MKLGSLAFALRCEACPVPEPPPVAIRLGEAGITCLANRARHLSALVISLIESMSRSCRVKAIRVGHTAKVLHV